MDRKIPLPRGRNRRVRTTVLQVLALSHYTCGGFRGWCKRRGIGLRYGAVGKHGSIAIVERFIRSMKHEGTRRLVVPLRRKRRWTATSGPRPPGR